MQYGRFLPRDAMLSALHAVIVCLSVRPSVCLCVSVTLGYCMKTAKRMITQIMPHDSPGTLVSILTSASRGSSAIPKLLVVCHVLRTLWLLHYVNTSCKLQQRTCTHVTTLIVTQPAQSLYSAVGLLTPTSPTLLCIPTKMQHPVSSASRNRIWCILALKSEISWQQF